MNRNYSKLLLLVISVTLSIYIGFQLQTGSAQQQSKAETITIKELKDHILALNLFLPGL